ncbi:glycosyltransferase family 39 protein [Chloroflexus sp.]|uniref:glycosyltransferase family 39 protein n=1 Tax=Chloroflexus sp. TaxID=1904827 RepID=UPI00298F34AB|nr:glycosyltransferase family 39 protein [Chloroflexus sp.]MDW8402665.1 glycosyltransferase family 39 protein [Chloroflexus sp.]
MTPPRPSSRWPALLLGASFVALYLLTLTKVHTYDALSYILDVDRKPWPELFHPHHLLYGPLGALIRWLATSLGWQGSAELWLQVVNALAGAVGVSLTFLLCRAVTGAPIASLAAALSVGWSFAYWYYAVEVEVYTLAAVALIAALWLLANIARWPTWQTAFWLGVANGMATLGHQTNVLLAVPALVTIGWAVLDHRARFRLAVAYSLPLAMIVGGAYLWVALGVSGMRRWDEVWAWLTGYARTGFWGGAIDGAKLAGLGKGWSETLAMTGGAIVGAIALGLLLAGWRGMARLPRPLLAGTQSWLLVYSLFFLWWEPDNIEFWIACLPPLALLLSAALAARHPLDRLGVGGASIAGLGLAVALLALNLPAIIERGDANRDLQRRIAAALAEISQPGDLIIVPDGVLELYLPHYWGRDTVYGLNQAMTASGGNWPAACALIQQRIETALASGYAVLVADEAQRPLPAPPGQPPTPAERFGLTADQVAACYAPMQAKLRPVTLAADLPPYHMIPRANALLWADGWDFRAGRWGWRAVGIVAETMTAAGWQMTPAFDPALISPPLLFSLADVAAIEVRLAATTAARDAQLFLLDPNGQTSEAYSLRFTLAQGAVMQTYRLDVTALADRLELVGGLRFDPVSAGDGGMVIVESIRLVRRPVLSDE